MDSFTVGTRLAERLRSYLDARAAVDRLKTYCHSGHYEGFHFQSYGDGVDDPHRISSDDLLATTMLSIGVSPKSRSGLRPSQMLRIERDGVQLRSLLDELPTVIALHELPEHDVDIVLGEASGGAAWRLFRYVRDEIGIPRIAAYKLLARKRPHLLPVRDTVVERALGYRPRDRHWWTAWWAALHTAPDLVHQLRSLRADAGVPSDAVSLLRVADICVWMAGR